MTCIICHREPRRNAKVIIMEPAVKTSLGFERTMMLSNESVIAHDGCLRRRMGRYMR